jgi:hypothetical protein
VNPLVLGSSPSGPTNPSSADVLGCRPASTDITFRSYKTRSYVRSASAGGNPGPLTGRHCRGQLVRKTVRRLYCLARAKLTWPNALIDPPQGSRFTPLRARTGAGSGDTEPALRFEPDGYLVALRR